MANTSDIDLARRIENTSTTEAAVTFTSNADNSRHRFKFVMQENETQMWRIHEVKTDRAWRIVGCEPIQRLTICAEADDNWRTRGGQD